MHLLRTRLISYIYIILFVQYFASFVATSSQNDFSSFTLSTSVDQIIWKRKKIGNKLWNDNLSCGLRALVYPVPILRIIMDYFLSVQYLSRVLHIDFNGKNQDSLE